MLVLRSHRAEAHVHLLSGLLPPATSTLGVHTFSGLFALLKVQNNGQSLWKREKAEEEDSSLPHFV